ncbi:MAG: acyl-CoA dehydrogenase family protein [Deltaproteobacteria bacterium]|nr:acyl-CoA dehydrogenase family protein [Deltaproteobacteria bacterium]
MSASLSPAPLTHLSDEESLFRTSVRDFAERTIRPRVAEMDRDARLAPEVLRGLFEMGLMGIEVPTELGGAGASFFTTVLAVEEISRVDPAVGVLVDVQNTVVMSALLKHANDDQRRRFLPRLATERPGSFCLSESGSGSDAFALACRAHPVDGGFRLEGRKMWVTNAREAGTFVIFANVNPEAGYKGITAFVVEREAPGLTVGKAEDKLGIRASSTCELLLDGCFVAHEQVLGEVGRGYKIAIELLNEGRIGIGAQLVGLARGALEQALAYALTREQFGRPIATNQGMQFWLAELAVDVETARLTVYNAARLREAGQPFVKEAAIAKYHASQVAERVASRALEVFGGAGFTKDYPAEKLFRDAKIGKIYEGTSFMQLQTIAKLILGE